MANLGTLFRFKIQLSDVDRDLYETLDFRAQMHPSESEDYLLTRVIAYALNFESGLEFLPGLCVGDEPAIQFKSSHGEILKWIDIGNPSPRRIHKASKAARSVRIYTYKDPQNLKRECAGEKIHRADQIEIFALDPSFLKDLIGTLKKDNQWGLIHNEGELVVTVGDESFISTLVLHSLNSASN